jgi:CRISPR-associated protein Csm4
MKLYYITIKPESAFGTPMKGDTIFGHVCWQAAYDDGLLSGGLKKWVDCYAEKPFAVFSSAWPVFVQSNSTRYAVKRPDLPPSILFPDLAGNKRKTMENRKDNLKKKWMLLDEDLKIDLKDASYLSDTRLLSNFTQIDGVKNDIGLIEESERQHNSINRLTGTTGEGFAPFSINAFGYYPFTELAVFILIDDEATDIERIETAFKRIGLSGFGKDASTGMGRFSVVGADEIPIPKSGKDDAQYTLSPSVPDPGLCKDCYFTPFVRYGRHGDVLAKSGKPFKSPVLMADEGAVILPKDSSLLEKPYLGKGIKGISKTDEFVTIHQGYSICLTVKLPAGVEL